MQRKRLVLILIIAIGISITLTPSTTSSTTIIHEVATISSTSHDNFTIISSSEPITWCKDSKVNLIIWTIINSTLDTITFDILRDGTIQYSGMAESLSFMESIPIFCSVPITELNYGTYNYTLIATDGLDTKSDTVILNLVEGSTNTSNPLFDAMSFVVLIGGLLALYLAILFGFSSLSQHLGGVRRIEA